jgi:hypothetical protein
MVGARIATLKLGGDRKSDQTANLRIDVPTQQQAAELLNTSRRGIQTAV